MCFCGDVFGRKIKEKYSLNTIKTMTLEENKYIQLLHVNGLKIVFKDFENSAEAFAIVVKFWDIKKQNQIETIETDDDQTEEEELTFFPSDEEWNKITEGTRSITYNIDSYVITQGVEQPHRLYQVAQGKCRIEKTDNEGQTIVVGHIGRADLFGELSFLEGHGGRATASVVAHENGTVIEVIEGYYLDVLFEYYPGLSGRFYHQLGSVIANRLKERQLGIVKKEESESEIELSEDKSEISEKKDDEAKKNIIKRTQDMDKKGKKERKNSSRIIIEGKDEKEKKKEKIQAVS